MYLILNLIIHGLNDELSSIIMSIALFICLVFLYDWELSLFSINNLFIIIFFLVGCFYRYLIIGIYPDRAMYFALHPLADISEFNILTAIVILTSVVFLLIGYRLNLKKKRIIYKTKTLNNKKLSFDILLIIYFLMIIVVYLYKFNNIRYAVHGNYGTFDNLFNILSIFNQYIAYIVLCKFFLFKKKKYLFLYLLYLIPLSILSIISAWKGIIMFELLIYFIIYVKLTKNIYIKKYIIILLLVLFIIYPLISMYRINLQLGYKKYSYDINSIIDYDIKENILQYVSDRFSYYDEIYYVINVNQEKKDLFLENTGLIHESFIYGLIPRAIFSNKKVVNIGLQITHYLMDYPLNYYNNLSISYIGDVWISYGMFGVIIINLIFGLFIGKLEKHDKNKKIFTAKYALLGYSLINFIEGDIAAKAISLLMTIIIISIVDTFFALDTDINKEIIKGEI
jgi:oligosaccharide repeat unit polymerase